PPARMDQKSRTIAWPHGRIPADPQGDLIMSTPILPENALTLGMRPLLADLHPEWQTALKPVRDTLTSLASMLRQRRIQGAVIFPHDPFRALRRIRPQDVRVVILGQDPYHGPGQAQGL